MALKLTSEPQHWLKFGDWWLTSRESYMYDLLAAVTGRGIWQEAIATFVKDPTQPNMYRLLDALADQHFDSPAIIRDIVGTELAMELVVHRVLRAREEAHPDVRDLRKLVKGKCFKLDLDPDAPEYVVVGQNLRVVRYRRNDSPDYPLRTYPKVEGEVPVYVTNF